MGTMIGRRREMSEEQWLSKRQIGSSNASTILNINPFETPYQLWSELVSLKSAQEPNEHTESGKYLQPAVAGWFADKANVVVQEAEELWKHDEWPFLTATPDYYVIEDGEEGILEVKTTAAHNWKEWEGGPPNYYRAQVLHQLEVRGLRFAYIACLIGGKKLVYFRIEMDDHGRTFIRELLVPRAEEFLRMVRTKTPPSVTADDCHAVLEAYPMAGANRVGLTEEYIKLAQIYDNANKVIAYNEKVQAAAKAQLMQFIGDAEGADSSAWAVTWKNRKKGGLNQTRLKQERPDIWADYAQHGTTRVFTVKNKTKEVDDE